MGIFSLLKKQYVQNIQLTDTSTQSLVQLATLSNRLIMMGAALTVREFQVAVVVNEGKVADVFGPGTYALTQESLPILSGQRLWKDGMKSPFRANVYYVSTKLFADLIWETVNPIIIKSAHVDITVRASGTFAIRVTDAEKFMKQIFGSNQIYETSYMIGQCKSKLISGLTHTLNEATFPSNEFTSRYEEIGERAKNKLQAQYAAHGLELCSFIIEHIIPMEKGPLVSAGEAAATSILLGVSSQQVNIATCSCGYSLQPTMNYCPACGLRVASIQ